jgi:hypothetical protein
MNSALFGSDHHRTDVAYTSFVFPLLLLTTEISWEDEQLFKFGCWLELLCIRLWVLLLFYLNLNVVGQRLLSPKDFPTVFEFAL